MFLKLNDNKFVNTDMLVNIGVSEVNTDVPLNEEELKAEELKPEAERVTTKKVHAGFGVAATMINAQQDLLFLLSTKVEAEAKLKEVCKLANLPHLKLIRD